MENLISELIKLVQTTAPELWRIAETQVMAEAYAISVHRWMFVGIGVFCFLLFILFLLWAREDSDSFFWALTFFLLTVSWAWMFVDRTVEYNKMMMSPEYYAIDVLVNLVKSVGR